MWNCEVFSTRLIQHSVMTSLLLPIHQLTNRPESKGLLVARDYGLNPKHQTLYVSQCGFVPSYAWLHTPSGAFQKLRILPAICCWLAQILLIWSFVIVLLLAWCPRLCRNVDAVMWYMIRSLHRVFYFENWLDALRRSCVWLPAWLICSDVASVRNRLGAYFKCSREPLLGYFWNMPQRIWWNHQHRDRLRRDEAVTPSAW